MRYFWHTLVATAVRLRGEAGRYVCAGLVSYTLGLGLSALFREGLRFTEEHAVALTLTILFLINFWLSRRFVFRADGSATKQFALFAATSFGMRAGEYGMFYIFLQFLHLHYLAALTAALLISNALKFFLYRTLVFRRLGAIPLNVRRSEACDD